MVNNNCTICYNPEIDKLIYEVKTSLSNLSQEVVKALENGYSCDKKAFAKIKTLSSFLKVLVTENRKRTLGGGCLTPFKLQSLAEKVRKYVTSCNIDQRKDLTVNKSKEDQWVAQNPFCVSREKWERLAYRICKAFTIEIAVTKDSDDCDITLSPKVLTVEEACNLTFEITRNLIPCDVVVAISVYENVCDHQLTITRTEEQCELDFKILVTEHNCNIDLDLYKTLIECNVSFDIIRTVYENGCSFEYDESEAVILVSALNKYPLSKLKFGGNINPQEIKKLGLNTKDSKYLKNPKSFIEKLKSDYGK